MTLEELLSRLAPALERAQVACMLRGSVASSAHGTPRSAVGLDIVIAPTQAQLLTLIAKLRWARLGGSDRQLQDAAGIIGTQGARLDISYIERWVCELHLEEQWQAVREGRRGA